IFVTLDPEKFGPLLEKVATAVGRMPPPRPGSVSFHLEGNIEYPQREPGMSDTSHPTMTEDERAIREVIATWLRASAEGDTAKVLSLMADDVVFLVPGHRPFGKEAFARGQE